MPDAWRDVGRKTNMLGILHFLDAPGFCGRMRLGTMASRVKAYRAMRHDPLVVWC
jgi:hypothetical protein